MTTSGTNSIEYASSALEQPKIGPARKSVDPVFDPEAPTANDFVEYDTGKRNRRFCLIGGSIGICVAVTVWFCLFVIPLVIFLIVWFTALNTIQNTPRWTDDDWPSHWDGSSPWDSYSIIDWPQVTTDSLTSGPGEYAAVDYVDEDDEDDEDVNISEFQTMIPDTSDSDLN